MASLPSLPTGTACGYAALTKAPPGYEVVTVELKINLVRPALGDHVLTIGKVQNAGMLLTVYTGEVRASLAHISTLLPCRRSIHCAA
jgi:acyl-coenzyme A thioesterase PaaI-like protein